MGFETVSWNGCHRRLLNVRMIVTEDNYSEIPLMGTKYSLGGNFTSCLTFDEWIHLHERKCLLFRGLCHRADVIIRLIIVKFHLFEFYILELNVTWRLTLDGWIYLYGCYTVICRNARNCSDSYRFNRKNNGNNWCSSYCREEFVICLIYQYIPNTATRFCTVSVNQVAHKSILLYH